MIKEKIKPAVFKQAAGPWGFLLVTTIKKSDGIFRLRDETIVFYNLI